MNPGISSLLRLISSYFWAPIIIKLTNLMNTMASVVIPPSRVCDRACWGQGGSDFTDVLQIILKSEYFASCLGHMPWVKNDIFLTPLGPHGPSVIQPYLWAPAILPCWLLPDHGVACLPLCLDTQLDCKPHEQWKGVLLTYEFLIPNITCGTFMLFLVNICWVNLHTTLLVWQRSCKLRTMPLNCEILQGTHHFCSTYHNDHLQQGLTHSSHSMNVCTKKEGFSQGSEKRIWWHKIWPWSYDVGLNQESTIIFCKEPAVNILDLQVLLSLATTQFCIVP